MACVPLAPGGGDGEIRPFHPVPHGNVPSRHVGDRVGDQVRGDPLRAALLEGVGALFDESERTHSDADDAAAPGRRLAGQVQAAAVKGLLGRRGGKLDESRGLPGLLGVHDC